MTTRDSPGDTRKAIRRAACLLGCAGCVLVGAAIARADEPPAEKHELGITWALLPIVGYSPETSASGGAKFRESDLFGWGAAFDVQGSYALEQQQYARIALEDPHLFGSRFSLASSVAWESDPGKEFFGLGNDSLGPDPASTHLFQDASARLALGVWLTAQLHYGFSAEVRQVELGRPRHDGQHPTSTRERFPDLAGVGGGQVRILRLDLVYDDAPEELRPIDGWHLAGFVEEVGPSLDNAFNYTFYSAEVARRLGIHRDWLVLAGRARAQYVEGVPSEIPFWAYPSLGGADTLRGYFPDRFLGRGSALVNTELRVKVAAFDFFDLWRVTIDAVGFGDFGRVYLAEEAFSKEVVRDWKASWGGGVRFFLSSGLVARVDVGFSDEEQALIYLRFGQMF
ncbi:MAG: BamA/TamA family outer membrane protein [bacterium]